MKTHPLERHAHGMTLVEVLVAITLGLLVIAGIGQIYTATKRSYDIQSNMARLQDVGRYAIETISQDIRRAGFWGMTDMRVLYRNGRASTPPGQGFPSGFADADGTCSSTSSSWARMVMQPIFGLNDTVTNYDCIPTSDHSRGDVLVVHYADPIAVTTYDGDHLYIRTTPYEARITWGDPDTSITPASADRDLPAYPLPVATVSDHPIIAHAYYVSDVRSDSSPTCNGVPIPSLSREEAGTLGKPVRKGLVAGVEDLQFQYGIDALGDGSVDRYLNAGDTDLTTVVDWDQVIAVRVWVLVRAECPETGYVNNTTYVFGDRSYTPNDNYRRQLYSTTVALRN